MLDCSGDRSGLVGSGFASLRWRWRFAKGIVEPPEELSVEVTPDISCTKSHPFTVEVELVTMSISGRANQRQRDTPANAECEIGECAQLLPSQRSGLVVHILALDSLTLVFLSQSNQIDPLVRCGKIQLLSHTNRQISTQEHAFKFGCILGMELQKMPSEKLKAVTFLLLCES